MWGETNKKPHQKSNLVCRFQITSPDTESLYVLLWQLRKTPPTKTHPVLWNSCRTSLNDKIIFQDREKNSGVEKSKIYNHRTISVGRDNCSSPGWMVYLICSSPHLVEFLSIYKDGFTASLDKLFPYLIILTDLFFSLLTTYSKFPCGNFVLWFLFYLCCLGALTIPTLATRTTRTGEKWTIKLLWLIRVEVRPKRKWTYGNITLSSKRLLTHFGLVSYKTFVSTSFLDFWMKIKKKRHLSRGMRDMRALQIQG